MLKQLEEEREERNGKRQATRDAGDENVSDDEDNIIIPLMVNTLEKSPGSTPVVIGKGYGTAGLNLFTDKEAIRKCAYCLVAQFSRTSTSQMQGIVENNIFQGSGSQPSSPGIQYRRGHVPANIAFFVGRDHEVEKLVLLFSREEANQKRVRIIILGQGGMGKTALAVEVVNHPDIKRYYGDRVSIKMTL
ncbi:hypothetical protein C8J56DRAFT_893893 [Mycena floridula]|nr:hypothetical protein C8J56DRAFT_893893 [Mycena floridula]